MPWGGVSGWNFDILCLKPIFLKKKKSKNFHFGKDFPYNGLKTVFLPFFAHPILAAPKNRRKSLLSLFLRDLGSLNEVNRGGKTLVLPHFDSQSRILQNNRRSAKNRHFSPYFRFLGGFGKDLPWKRKIENFLSTLACPAAVCVLSSPIKLYIGRKYDTWRIFWL